MRTRAPYSSASLPVGTWHKMYGKKNAPSMMPCSDCDQWYLGPRPFVAGFELLSAIVSAGQASECLVVPFDSTTMDTMATFRLLRLT